MSQQKNDSSSREPETKLPAFMRVLVIFSHSYWPLRVSVADHIYAIRRYSKHKVYYFNAIGGQIPSYLRNVKFDAIIYHTSLLSRRWDRVAFAKYSPLASSLATMSTMRIALPQDEFINTDILEDWLLNAKVDVVCSVLRAVEWRKVYPRLVAKGVRLDQVLTGYLSDEFLSLAASAVEKTPKRDVDIGYRAWGATPSLGRHGRLKVEIAHRVKSISDQVALVTDISTENRDSISGFDWLLFLARCRYVLGVEGGASIHDKDGSIRAITEDFVRAHPLASFDEIEAACFPSRDGELDCRALSPRHLEACATRTAQILVEGEYNGLLKPNLHYFAVKSDFSNLKDVLDRLGNEERRREVADRAYRDVVKSGAGSYRMFVGLIDNLVDGARSVDDLSSSSRTTADDVSMWLKLTLLRCHMMLLDVAIIGIWSTMAIVVKSARVFGWQMDSSDIIKFSRRAIWCRR